MYSKMKSVSKTKRRKCNQRLKCVTKDSKAQSIIKGKECNQRLKVQSKARRKGEDQQKEITSQTD